MLTKYFMKEKNMIQIQKAQARTIRKNVVLLFKFNLSSNNVYINTGNTFFQIIR